MFQFDLIDQFGNWVGEAFLRHGQQRDDRTRFEQIGTMTPFSQLDEDVDHRDVLPVRMTWRVD